jgi:hypothetical protein
VQSALFAWKLSNQEKISVEPREDYAMWAPLRLIFPLPAAGKISRIILRRTALCQLVEQAVFKVRTLRVLLL